MTGATQPAFRPVSFKTTRLQEMILLAGRFAREQPPVEVQSEG